MDQRPVCRAPAVAAELVRDVRRLAGADEVVGLDRLLSPLRAMVAVRVAPRFAVVAGKVGLDQRPACRAGARGRAQARVLGEARVQARVLGEVRVRGQAQAQVELRSARRFAGADEVVDLQRLLAARVCIAAARLARPVQRLPGLAGVVDLAKIRVSPAGGTGARAHFYFSELDPACSAPASSVTLLRKQAVPSAQPERRLAKVRDQRAR